MTTVSMTINLFFAPHIRMLQESGHTVELACNQDEPLGENILALGCKSYDIPFSRSPLDSDNIRAYRTLRRVIRDGHFDIVHTHTPIASALVRLACRKQRSQGLRVFYTAHGFHFFSGAPLKNWLIYYPAELLCSRFTDKQITITREDYERARRHLHARETVYLPGVGVDTAGFLAGRSRKIGRCRAEFGIPDDALLLLSAGELSANKNHAAVLRALTLLGAESIYYVICGEGPSRPELERMIEENGLSDRVTLAGQRRDVPEWMAEADIYIHPSHREGLSVAIMEAMASGLPVICGDIRGNRDLIEDGVGGLLIRPDDAPQIADAIVNLQRADTLRVQMGRHNQEAVRRFSLEQVLCELRTLYGI